MAHLESLVILDAAGRSGAALAFGFERAGYHVYATREADDALAMAQTRVPQLLVVAVDGGESLSFVGRVREDAPTRELPVVGVGERDRREEALRAGVDDFVTRPAFIRDVLTLSRLAVAVRQDGDDGGVVGLLEDYGLYFLVRALAVAGRSGVLELERGRRMGEVRFAHGAVVAARVGRMSGVQAFNHLLLWGEASMSLRFESPAVERRIAVPVDDLLSSGAGFAREFESLAERVGGAQALFAHEPRRAAEQRSQIPVEVMALLKHYDGQKPLIDVVEDSPFKPFDTIKITYRLFELGAISRREQRDATPLSAQLAVRDWLLGDGEAEGQSRERPASPRGLTEAGRRAAEVYGDETARQTKEPSPADDLLDDRAIVRAAAAATPTTPAAAAAKDEGRAERPTAKLASAAITPTKRPQAAVSGEISVPTRVTPAPTRTKDAPRVTPATGVAASGTPAAVSNPKPAPSDKARSPSAALDAALAARDAGRRNPTAAAASPPAGKSTTPSEPADVPAVGSGAPAVAPSSNRPAATKPAAAPPAEPAAAAAATKPAAAPTPAATKPAAAAAPVAAEKPAAAPAPTATKPAAAPAPAATKPAAAPAAPAATPAAPAAAKPTAASPSATTSAAAPSAPTATAPPPPPASNGAAKPSAPPANAAAARAAAPPPPAAASPRAATPPAAKMTPPSPSKSEVPRPSAEPAQKSADTKGKKGRRRQKTPSGHADAAPPYHAVPSPASTDSRAQSGKLSLESSTSAHAKEPVFDELEEDFFAREAEHLEHAVTAEDFSDLEHTAATRKLSVKRNWFGLRDEKKKK